MPGTSSTAASRPPVSHRRSPQAGAVATAEDLGPFARRAALARGIGRHELDGPLWHRPFRDVHVWSSLDADDPDLRTCLAGRLLPAGAAIGGWAAARVLGVLDLDGRSHDGHLEPVLLCLSRPQQVLRRAGIRPFRSDLDLDDVINVAGMPVTSPVRTCFDLGRLAGSLREAVVLLDAALRDLGVPPGDLSAYAADRRRWRGVPRLHQALPLVDTHAASPGESRLRLCWVLDADLPTPQANREIRDEQGRLLGITDLLEPHSGLASEYDGHFHRPVARQTADQVREEALERAGLVVVRATVLDVGPHRHRLAQRLRDGQDLARSQAARRRWVMGPHRDVRR